VARKDVEKRYYFVRSDLSFNQGGESATLLMFISQSKQPLDRPNWGLNWAVKIEFRNWMQVVQNKTEEQPEKSDWYEDITISGMSVEASSRWNFSESLEVAKIINRKLEKADRLDPMGVYKAIVGRTFIEVTEDYRSGRYVKIDEIDPEDWKVYVAYGVKHDADGNIKTRTRNGEVVNDEYTLVEVSASDENTARLLVGQFIVQPENINLIKDWSDNKLKLVESPRNRYFPSPTWNKTFAEKVALIMPKGTVIEEPVESAEDVDEDLIEDTEEEIESETEQTDNV
jgi:hypothetical protein